MIADSKYISKKCHNGHKIILLDIIQYDIFSLKCYHNYHKIMKLHSENVTQQIEAIKIQPAYLCYYTG